MDESTNAISVSRQPTGAASRLDGSPLKRLYGVDDTAIYIGRTSVAVRDLVRRKKLRIVKTDARIMLDVHDLDAWIEAGKKD